MVVGKSCASGAAWQVAGGSGAVNRGSGVLRVAAGSAATARSKSFLLLFFKKEGLSFLAVFWSG
jgi:hypothetical protein